MAIDALIASLSSGEHEIYPVATSEDVGETESAIGYTLPNSFREFVTKFSNGAYLYMIQEVSAVGAGNSQVSSIQNIEWLKGDPNERIEFRDGEYTFLRYLIPFSLDSNGNAWCFLVEDSSQDSEYSVVYFDTSGRRLYGRLYSFSTWLNILIDNEDEVIRTVCEEDEIRDELNLG